MRNTTRIASSCALPEILEPRRLFAAAVTAVMGNDGVILITGTRRADDVSVVEHAPGAGIYDVLANGSLINQFSSGNAIRIEGRGGNDVLSVATGIGLPATIVGGSGNDRVTGGGGADSIDGGAGRDVLDGGTGDDSLFGRQGNDNLDGGSGNDSLDGGAGQDNIVGGAGDDVLTGGRGRDTLEGGDGNDSLDGGASRDVLTGGPGADVFNSTDRESEVSDLLPEDSH